jgi:TatA/E family protein of Tat protein translocase
MTATHAPIAFLDSLGGSEMILILVVVLIFFGGEKMPEFAKGLGKAIREFKKAAGDVEHEFKRAIDELPDKPAIASFKPVPAPSSVPATIEPPAVHPRLAEPPAPPEDPKSDHGIDG